MRKEIHNHNGLILSLEIELDGIAGTWRIGEWAVSSYLHGFETRATTPSGVSYGEDGMRIAEQYAKGTFNAIVGAELV